MWSSMLSRGMITGGYFPRSKAPGHEADHSPPPSAEVKNALNYSSFPTYIFMACSLNMLTVILIIADEEVLLSLG
jgi:hypothetical protein